MFSHGERELGAALLAQVALGPRRLGRQRVQQPVQQLLCRYLRRNKVYSFNDG